MVSCIICHLGITEGLDEYQNCPNGHPSHNDCLKEWLVHSPNCPLCREPYPSNVIKKFQGYVDQKERETQSVLDNKIRQEAMKKIEKVASRMAFLKFLESIDVLIQASEFDYALSRLEFHENDHKSKESSQDILFLKGKINFLKGRYDLAINQLFKLVKENFDYPDGFLFLGKAYEALGLEDQAQWAYERIK